MDEESLKHPRQLFSREKVQGRKAAPGHGWEYGRRPRRGGSSVFLKFCENGL